MSDERAERRRRERIARKGQHAREQEELAIEREWEIDPAWQAYTMHARTELAPMIYGSGMTISIVPAKPEDVDVKFAMETGLSIMFDKPIILCVATGATVPAKLLAVADHVVTGDPEDPIVRAQLVAAIAAVKEKLGDAE